MQVDPYYIYLSLKIVEKFEKFFWISKSLRDYLQGNNKKLTTFKNVGKGTKTRKIRELKIFELNHDFITA